MDESDNRADSRFAPSQWETALLCNDVSHWLGASLESALKLVFTAVSTAKSTIDTPYIVCCIIIHNIITTEWLHSKFVFCIASSFDWRKADIICQNLIFHQLVYIYCVRTIRNLQKREWPRGCCCHNGRGEKCIVTITLNRLAFVMIRTCRYKPRLKPVVNNHGVHNLVPGGVYKKLWAL